MVISIGIAFDHFAVAAPPPASAAYSPPPSPHIAVPLHSIPSPLTCNEAERCIKVAKDRRVVPLLPLINVVGTGMCNGVNVGESLNVNREAIGFGFRV